MAEQCDSCKFMRYRTYGTAQVLECRVSDPMAVGQLGKWPEVKASDWCGKYVVAVVQERTLGEVPL